MSVHILNEQPVHVIPGSKLVLTARIEKNLREEISTITWTREPETGHDRTKVTLATCPAKSPKCSGGNPDVQVSLKQQETTLEMNRYSTDDRGEYSVTVTHHVSVSINVSYSLLVCREAWGTDPSFSWLHERAAVTQQVGKVSKDGHMLIVTMTPLCGHFTCMVGNKLGYSSGTYAAPCESEGRGTTAAVVCLVLLLMVCGGVLAFLLW
uniref:Si:dkeyp-97a10.2 n=1 Tax=Poecilia reticulata TaxID=8081 RepID=A0A3P9NJK0_POERE